MNRIRTYLRFLAVKRSIRFLTNNLLTHPNSEGEMNLHFHYADYRELYEDMYYRKKKAPKHKEGDPVVN